MSEGLSDEGSGDAGDDARDRNDGGGEAGMF